MATAFAVDIAIEKSDGVSRRNLLRGIAGIVLDETKLIKNDKKVIIPNETFVIENISAFIFITTTRVLTAVMTRTVASVEQTIEFEIRKVFMLSSDITSLSLLNEANEATNAVIEYVAN